jgi:hypothetical protein
VYGTDGDALGRRWRSPRVLEASQFDLEGRSIDEDLTENNAERFEQGIGEITTLRHIGTAASSPIGPDALSAVSPRMLSRSVAKLPHPTE